MGPSWPWSFAIGAYISPLMLWVRLLLRARCTALCDQVCQWLTVVFSGSSTNKTNCHDITEILLKVALNTTKTNQIQLWSISWKTRIFCFLETIHFWKTTITITLNNWDFKIFAKTYMYNFHISNCKITMLTTVWWQNNYVNGCMMTK